MVSLVLPRAEIAASVYAFDVDKAVAIAVVIVVEKLGSSFIAAAISFSVSSSAGEVSTKLAIAWFTYDWLAIVFVFTDKVIVFATLS